MTEATENTENTETDVDEKTDNKAETPAPTNYVKWFVVETDKGFVARNEDEFKGMDSPNRVYGPDVFKTTFQELYRLRAEKAGVKNYCKRCGHFESHNYWCRVPEEQAKAAMAAQA